MTTPPGGSKSRLRAVDPRLVKIPEIRVTSYMDETEQAAFKATVAATGLLEAPVCLEVDGALVCVDGRNRIEEAIVQGLSRIQVQVSEGSMEDVYMRNLVTTTLRGKPRLAEVVRVLSHLYHELKLPVEDLYDRTGLPERYVDDLLVISEAGTAVLQAIDDGWLHKTHALLLASVKDPQVRDQLLFDTRVRGYSAKQLGEIIAIVQQQQETTAQGEAQPVPHVEAVLSCTYCQRTYPSKDVANVLVCPGCNGLMYEAMRAGQRGIDGSVTP